MKFMNLELYHVGRHNGQVFTNLSDGFNLIYGPNEAGKSTLLAGVRAMLFGRLTGGEPHLGIVRGAAGILRAKSESGQVYTLERALGRKSPVKVQGPDMDPQAGDEGLFMAFPELEQVEASIYQSVFTFQLQELSDLSEHRSQLAQKLYTVGMIGDASPLQLEAAFRKAARDIYNPDKRARNPLLTQCLNNLKELDEERQKQQDEVAAYMKVQQSVQSAEEQLRHHAEVIEEVSQQREHLHQLKQALPLYQTAQANLAEQGMYGPRYEIEDTVVTRVQQLEADMIRLDKEKLDQQQEIRRLTAELGQRQVKPELLELLPDIRKESSRSQRMLALADWLDESRQDIVALQMKNEERTARLSGNWSLQQLAQLQIDTKILTAAQEYSELWKQVQMQLQQVGQQASTGKEQLRHREERLQSLGFSAASFGSELQTAQADLRQQREDFHHDEEQVELYAAVRDEQKALEQELERLQTAAAGQAAVDEKNRDMPLAVFHGFGLVLAVLGVWELVETAVVTGVITLIAAGTALALGLWTSRRRQLYGTRRETTVQQHRLEELQQALTSTEHAAAAVLDKLKSIRIDADKTVFAVRRALKERLLELEEETDRLQTAKSAVEAYAEAKHEIQSLFRQQQNLQGESDKIQDRSIQLQQQAGWNEENAVPASTWVEELKIVQNVIQTQYEIRLKLEKAKDYQLEMSSFVTAVRELLQRVYQTNSSMAVGAAELAVAKDADPSVLWDEKISTQFQDEVRTVLNEVREASDKLPELYREAESAVEMQREHEILKTQLAETYEKLHRAEESLQHRVDETEAIYSDHGVHNAQEFAGFVKELKTFHELKSAYRDVMMQLYGVCGGKTQFEELEPKLRSTSLQQIDENLAYNEEQLRGLRQEQKALNKQLGELQAMLNHWDSAKREKLEWELAQVKAERDKLAFQWAGYRIAEALVKTARERYEEQRQPQVLQTAGHLFQQITSCRYQGFKSRFDEHGAARFVAVDANGREWSFRALSRGTREQIYLCLRIALIRDYVKRGIRMPIVLDDPLVNFDIPRLEETVRLLGEQAKDCQVIYLTCHEATANRISRILPVHSVELGHAKGGN